MANGDKRTGGSSVPVTGKIGKAAPTASSGGGVDTGPVEDDRMPATSMDADTPFESIEPTEEETQT